MKTRDNTELLAMMACTIAAGMVKKPGVAPLAESDATRVADESIRIAKRILGGVELDIKAKDDEDDEDDKDDDDED